MEQPKLSLGSWAFTFGPFAGDPWPFERVLDFLAEAGYDGVEINGFRPHPHPDDFDTPAKCRALVREIEARGLGISGYAPSFHDTPPADVEAEIYLRALWKCLDFCNRCGITTLRVDTVTPPDGPVADDHDSRFARLTRSWHAAAVEAAKAGVLIVWEFEPGFWLNKPSDVMRTVEAVGHENFKVLFDTSHAYMGAVMGARQSGEREVVVGGVAEYGRLLGEHIGHVHLIDSDGTLHNQETSTHATFGKGYIEFGELLSAMRPFIGGLPWWCVDFCFNPDTPTAARDAVQIVRRLRRDALA